MDHSKQKRLRSQKHLRIFRLLICSLLAAVLVSCATIDLKGPAPETDNFQSRLILGRQYLNTRHHSLALAEFTDAGRLRPGEAAPVHGRAEALFHMGRMDEALAACSELGGESPDYFIALGFCWGIRLEVGSAAEEIRENVRQEIAELLNRPEPSVELLYSAYQGYYYLNDQEKRFALIRQLIEKGNGSAMTAEIASTLFSEIIESPPGSDRRLDLAERYIRNFSDQRMADKAATIVFRELSAKQQDEPDHQQLVRSVLQDKATSPYLNGAAAFWLIEHNTDFPQAIHLLQQSLRGIEELSLEIPEPFSETLWGEEIENFRMLSLYLLGRARLGLGETAEARKLFTEVAAMKESWPGPHHFLGMIHLGDGQPEQALQFFRKALVNGSPRPETTTELRAILSDRDGFNGDPRTYFQTQEQDGVWFTDVTVAAGLDGVRASRVAWGDYDNDGDDDLLLDGSRLFSNQGDGGFVPDSDRLAGIAGSNGGVFGDYDNDGSLDIFVTSHGGNHLLHNEDGVRFVESGAFPQTASPFLRTEAAAWGDLNNDGLLDLYVANYEHGVVMRGVCGRDQLFVNRGEGGFAESSAAVGVVSEEGMCGRGVTWSDLDGDGWQDILVANYRLDPNFLWLNQGNSSVVDAAEANGVQGREVNGAYGHSIGSVSGDLDGDGDLDIITSNLAHPRYIAFSDKTMVLINNGGPLPLFTDRYPESGISFDETNSDPLLFDVDLDGDLDLYVTSIYPNRASHLYLNDGSGGFTDRTWLSGAGVTNGWGAATADFDGDGFPDLLVAGSEGVRLLHNEGGPNNWLKVRVDDRNCNRFGVGSKVTARFDRQRQVREITAGRGTGSQDSLTVHFGLGHFRGPVSIEVKSLCGETMQDQTTELNRTLVISNQPSPD